MVEIKEIGKGATKDLEAEGFDSGIEYKQVFKLKFSKYNVTFSMNVF